MTDKHQHSGNCCGQSASNLHQQRRKKKYTDPVCGMQVAKNTEKTARFRASPIISAASHA
jgi:hypothetical protein